MKNKYEVVTGLAVGSKLGNLNREMKELMTKYLNGDKSAFNRIMQISRQREDLLKSKRFVDKSCKR